MAVRLPDNNTVLVLGGTSGGRRLYTTELFVPWRDRFESTGSLAVERDMPAVSPLGLEGRLVAAGGAAGSDHGASAELYGFPTVRTDRDDYAPGETVLITGTGWQPGQKVRLLLEEDPRSHAEKDWIVKADAFGSISDSSFKPHKHDLGVSFRLTASALGSADTAQAAFTDSAGSYSIDFAAADPGDSPTYQKLGPGQLACPAPSGGGGTAADPLANAIFGGSEDAVESLAPASMILGQIVPFEIEVKVSGSTSPEGGRIEVNPYWLARTTNGGVFGFDPAYSVYCAFVDTADSASVGLDGNEKVDSSAARSPTPARTTSRSRARPRSPASTTATAWWSRCGWC